MTLQSFTKICKGCKKPLPYEQFHYKALRAYKAKTLRVSSLAQCNTCTDRGYCSQEDKASDVYLCSLLKITQVFYFSPKGVLWYTEMQKEKAYDKFTQKQDSYFQRNDITSPTAEQKEAVFYYLIHESIEEEIETELYNRWNKGTLQPFTYEAWVKFLKANKPPKKKKKVILY